MKKILFFTVLMITGLGITQAQNEFDSIFEEMKKMQQELLKNLDQVEQDGNTFQFFFDTLFIEDLGDLGMDFNGQRYQELDPAVFEGLFEEMQRQFEQMDEEDLQELEQLFRGFDQLLPMSPNSIIPQEEETSPGQTKDGKKKRKIYKM